MNKAIFFFGVLCLGFSCNKKGTLGPQSVPSSLAFIVKKNGNRLPDSILNYMKLSYLQNGVKNYLTDFTRGTNEGSFLAYDLGIQSSRLIGFRSGDDGIKNFYIEYPDGKQDTLFVDYKHLNDNDAVDNPCFCHYPLVSVKFNGQIAPFDSSITQLKVSLFNKP